MRVFLSSIIFAVMISFAFTSFAQGVQYAEQTEYSFDDDVVTGDLVRPDGELLVTRKKGSDKSLIHVRQHFIPEMLKSVENL